MEAVSVMGLENLGEHILEAILLKLGPREATVVACVSSGLRVVSSGENLWRYFCVSDFDLSSPEDPQGRPCPSFKAAYEQWLKSFLMYPLPLVRRAKQCWSSIRSWMAINFPEANDTLRRGATEAEIKRAEEKLGSKFPLPTRILYRFCDGQDTEAFDRSQYRHLALLGIIGGYQFYNHLVNVHLLSLSQIVKETKELQTMGFKSKTIVVAMSNYLDKRFLLNCSSGQLYVGTIDMLSAGELMLCVPSELLKPESDATNGLPQGALMLWLEEHNRRLHNGIIQTRVLRNARAICLFPEAISGTPMVRRSEAIGSSTSSLTTYSTAVTNGVQIRASAVFVPELSILNGERKQYYYSYSIRMSLIPEECFLNGVYYSTCQLSRRHWIIRSKDNIVDDVSGEAVIGLYPHLRPNQKEFVYESCTPLPNAFGSIEGSFTFVPGSLAHPKGPPFEVNVAPFKLEVPEYIF